MYAIQISTTDSTDVDLEVIDLPAEQDACYERLCAIVGGFVERVSLSPGAIAIVNENGMDVLPRNPAATLFVATAVLEDGRDLIGQIHGNAVILGETTTGWAPIPVRELQRSLALASLVPTMPLSVG